MIGGISPVGSVYQMGGVSPISYAGSHLYRNMKAASLQRGQNGSGVYENGAADSAASAAKGSTGGTAAAFVNGTGNTAAASAGSIFGRTAAVPVGAVSPEVPVQPVRPVPAIQADEAGDNSYILPFLRKGMDPAELAVRMRMQYVDPAHSDGRGRTLPGEKEPSEASEAVLGAEGAQKASEEGECQTCKQRKYQDGSNDAGVSYKTPTHIAPEQAASAVRGHEMEHVVRERAAAEREDRKVVSQSVTMHTAICPECGKVYVSGGTTRTATMAESDQDNFIQKTQQSRKPFSAAA